MPDDKMIVIVEDVTNDLSPE